MTTSPTTLLRTDAERFWLSFRFPYGFGSRSPRRIVSAVSNLCKRIYFGLTNSICRSTKKKNLCKLGTFFSLVHHDELSFYLNSYEKVVLRNLGTCPIPSLQRLSWMSVEIQNGWLVRTFNIGQFLKKVNTLYIVFLKIKKPCDFWIKNPKIARSKQPHKLARRRSRNALESLYFICHI